MLGTRSVRALTVRTERTRLVSVFLVLLLAAGLTAFLFHDAEAVRVSLEAPGHAPPASVIEVASTVRVPAEQRLPVAGVTFVVESLAASQPALVDAATCWGDACTGGLRHVGGGPEVVGSIALTAASAPPSVGELRIRSEGYGTSQASGYGAEIEPRRTRSATDIEDEEGRSGHGLGYGGDEPVELRYAVTLAGLPAGAYQLTFLVETGSREMGQVSSPRSLLLVE